MKSLPLFLAILFLSCCQLASQIFMPALPAIASYFDIQNSEAQQIIMLYFISFGLSQLFYGPWSDLVGKRQVFLVGQLLFIVGSLLCMSAQSPSMLAWGRVIQGLGAGAPLIISRTILSQHLVGNQLQQATATLAIAASTIPVLAPFLGGLLTSIGNWQLVFGFVSVYLVATLWIGFYLLSAKSSQSVISSLKVQANKSLLPKSFIHAIKGYTGIMTDFRFILIAQFKWLITLIVFTSATFFPFELQQNLFLSPNEYGLAMMLPAIGLIIGTCLAKWAQKFNSYQNILMLFWPLLFLSGLGFLYLPLTLFNCLACYSLTMICAGAYYPCCLHLVAEPYPEKSGTVHALCGAIDMLIFSALAIVINKFWIHDSSALGVLYLLVSVVLFVCWLLLQRIRKTKMSNQIIIESN